jgi:hypothetical protein
MHTADPLQPMIFPSRDGTPVAAVISPDESMLTVETMLAAKMQAPQRMDAALVVLDPKPQVMLDFYRLTGGDAAGQPLKLSGVGLARAPGPLLLPMDADGYLWPGDPDRGRWPVSFNEFGGREVKIGEVDSSCAPRLQMVSRFEFLAFTCMGTDSRTRMKLYGMDGHDTWEESLGGMYGIPEFAYAPAAGRFAMSRISSTVEDMDGFAGAASVPDGATQEVRVYQTESGDLLLKVPTNPVTRFAENFDLSEDGLVAAVVNDGAVQVYRLPPPGKQDLKDLGEAKSFSPPVSDAPVSFAKLEATADEANGDVAAANASDAAGAVRGGAGGAPAAKVVPAADVTSGGPVGGGSAAPPAAAAPASATKDAADEISDEEAAKMLGARVPAAQPAKKGAAANADPAAQAEPAATTDAGVAAKDAGTTAKGEQAAQASGDATEQPRKPPTLLEPGEKVEQVKGSGQPR